MSLDLFIHVTHLFGIGHLSRAAAIARAACDLGLSVLLASGGRPVPGLDLGGARLLQLPPLRSRDETFAMLLDEQEKPLEPPYEARRRDRLLEVFAALRPKVLLTEMFPFGRRKLAFELLPLLDLAAAQEPRPRILASVRDLLVEKPPEKMRWMAETAERYDRILVHGDPRFLPFQASFPFCDRLGERLVHTGYVVDRPPPTVIRGEEVLVSAGGGAFGRRLLETALAARPLSPVAQAPWRLLAGVNATAESIAALEAAAGPGVTVERSRSDFPALLAHCRLSVSQGGYNTVAETLAARAPAVIVPFAAGGETEQAVRARLLAERGLVELLEEGRLGPAALAAAMGRALALRPPEPAALDLGGARASAEIIRAEAAMVSHASAV